ncbi:TraR/DksA family transcriptional regulator [Psychrobacter pocilloporae]|uniref:TraR/DksA family transcriptional regulator n=1 Tax=Psychrobacter pocilloporae TaxID=1775882 RepID=UPI003C2EA98F
MADDADRANDYVDLTMTQYLSRAPKFDKPSLAECMECGEDIPAKRQAVGGVTLCVDCQSVFEKRGR